MGFDTGALSSWFRFLLDQISALPNWVGPAALAGVAITFVAFAFDSARLNRLASRYHFVNDVLVRPSIGPVTAWLIGALIALVIWLTYEYAPGAAARAQMAEAQIGNEGIISKGAGYITVVFVSLLCLAFALEPYLGWRASPRWSPRERWHRLPRTFADRTALFAVQLPRRVVRGVLAFLAKAVFLTWHAPSFCLSLIDYLLARPFAFLAGAALQPSYLRYGWFLFLVFGGVWSAWTLQAPTGLIGVAVGVVAIVAMVRRWNWVERDREAFLVARGSDPSIERIGFAEDLRDEALIGIVFLFVLIPLGLRQIELAYDAFDLAPGARMPADELGQVLEWMGFFGAELAKAVPLVDWSEVFHVANGSPLRPKTALGAQVVFAIRASLDLLLIAAIVQAFQIASRVRDQVSAFKANRLPILDPFSELRAFRDVAAGIVKHPHVAVTKQPRVASFPDYEVRRLIEIASGGNFASSTKVLRDPTARRGATAVLAKQSNDEKAQAVLSAIILNEKEDDGLRSFALDIRADPARDVCLQVLRQRIGSGSELRLEAVRRLSRSGITSVGDDLLARLVDDRDHIAIRAQAGLSLAKLQDRRASEHLMLLANNFDARAAGDDLVPIMAVAYALALEPVKRSTKPEELAKCFVVPLQQYALRAIGSARGGHEAMIRIPSGEFLMGGAQSEESSDNQEVPQHRVYIREFNMAEFAVTFDEYDAFCRAQGRDLPADEGWGRGRRPAINVSWDDAHDYCDWLYGFTGEQFRLPSEAEWEYACRAGTITPFNFGETISSDQANYNGTYAYGDGKAGDYRNQTIPVGVLPPNAFGLFDMHGNVMEWCQDAWNWNYAQTGDRETERPDDGSPWLTGDPRSRVLRGGSWASPPQYLRSAYRSIVGRTHARINFIGFRLARNR